MSRFETARGVGALRRWLAPALLGIVALGLAGVPAAADPPRVIAEDNTGFACEYVPDGAPQVALNINYDAVTGTGYSSVDVLSPDGEVDLANGYTGSVRVGDGQVSARYPLLHPDGWPAGEVILEGTYTALADPVTLRNRYPVARNAAIIGTLTYTPLAVTWSTLQVGDYDVSGATCEGQRSETLNRVLEPHRYVATFSDLRLLGTCAQPPLTGFSLTPSEAGTSLILTLDGYQGFTNLGLDDGSDTASIEWYSEEGPQPADVTSITVSLTEDGRIRTEVEATRDGLVLKRIQPLALEYTVGLPDGGGEVSGSCAAESVQARIAVEPVG